MSILIALVLNALALIITASILPGIHIGSFTAAIVAAIILGIINAFVKPVLVYLTAPLNFLTLGLFSFVVNAVVLELVAAFTPNQGFRIDSFGWAVLGAIVLALVSTVLSMLLKDVAVGEGMAKTRKKKK